MESDDDYQLLSPPKDSSTQPHLRRLKRLKKSDSKHSKEPLAESLDDPLLFPSVDFARLEALENGLELPEVDDSNSAEESDYFQESLSQGIENDDEILNNSTEPYEKINKTKRVLEFCDDADGEEQNDREIGEGDEVFETEKIVEGDSFEEKEDKKKKKKRAKGDSGDNSENNKRRSNKRTEEKERKAYLDELHAESQKLLRETSNASFKPIPVVHKPLSSVLEKIRKRKLEISKKAVVVNEGSCLNEVPTDAGNKLLNFDAFSPEKGEDAAVTVPKDEIILSMDGESGLAASNGDDCEDFTEHMNYESFQNQESPKKELTPAFRMPVHDTEELFVDSEPNGATAELSNEQLDSPLDEDFAPSLLTMNLKFDSAPMDDSSSAEEDNDKENVDPHSLGTDDSRSSPPGDPARNFVDDEAEEEYDSDNDPNCFQENAEDEDIEDLEELNDLIATGYEERPVDNDRRNELHQKWLEQQDAVGTDNIMQKLGCGPVIRDAVLQDEESDDGDDDDEEELDEGVGEDFAPQNPARINTRKAKQIILQLLPEKEEAYLSDDDDTDKQRIQARCFIRKETNATTLVSPADDESSKEVFGLIKKLNIVPDSKKKAKAFSFFDSVLKGGNNNTSSKSSFLGRASNHSLPSIHRQQGSGTVRSFIFGRDDSNSRSSISAPEDTSDTAPQEIRQTRTSTAKYSSSQTISRTLSRNDAAETASRTSLLDILKRSSAKSSLIRTHDTTVDLTKSIFTFRAPKKPIKIEGRS